MEIYGPGPAGLKVGCGGREVGGLSSTYSEVLPGEATALVGGRGYLELVVNLGRADQYFGSRAGAQVVIEQDSF